MVDLIDIETEDGFDAESILDFAFNMVGEDCTQMTIKRMTTSAVADQMAFFHACMYIPVPTTLIKSEDNVFRSSFSPYR